MTRGWRKGNISGSKITEPGLKDTRGNKFQRNASIKSDSNGKKVDAKKETEKRK